jgi:hypothetical protein
MSKPVTENKQEQNNGLVLSEKERKKALAKGYYIQDKADYLFTKIASLRFALYQAKTKGEPFCIVTDDGAFTQIEYIDEELAEIMRIAESLKGLLSPNELEPLIFDE